MGFFVPVNGGFFFGGQGEHDNLLHMTKFYSKKVKDLMALIRQILKILKKKKKIVNKKSSCSSR
jgi:hypothetical protein